MAKASKKTESEAAGEAKEQPAKKPAAKKADAPKAETAPKATAAAAKKPAAKAAAKPAAKTPTKAGSTGAGAGAVPMVDTNLAAQAAAKMLLNRASGNAANDAGAPKKESGAFKQLKESLNKPNLGNLGGAAGPLGQQKHGNLPHQFQQQKGHNQTFGADVNRTGVPRRTPG